MKNQVQVDSQSMIRLTQTIADIQAQVQQIEAEFQARLEQAVQQTEERLRQELAEKHAEELKRAEEQVQKTVTHDLLERFEIEFHKLDSEFEQRRRNTEVAAETALELRLKEASEAAERVKEALRHESESAEKVWQSEREQFQQKIIRLETEAAANQAARANQAVSADLETKLTEAYQERARLEQQLRDAEVRLNNERTTLKAEFVQSRQDLLLRFDLQLKQLNAEFEEQRKRAVAETEGTAEARFGQRLQEEKEEFERREKESQAESGQALQDARDQFEAERKDFKKRIASLEDEAARQLMERAKLEEVRREKAKLEEEFQEATDRWNAERKSLPTSPSPAPAARGVSAQMETEIKRVESSVREISRKLEMTSTDLGAEIRLNRERSELEAYLKGLRYS